jgi:hypothetical protein
MAKKTNETPADPEKMGLYLPRSIARDLRIAAATQEKGISELAAEILAEALPRILAKR